MPTVAELVISWGIFRLPILSDIYFQICLEYNIIQTEEESCK